MVENCRSSGVATAEAIVSGLAPGSDAPTWMVGKSTFGRSLTGSCRYAMMPNSRMATMTSVVMTGRRMKMAAMFMIGVSCQDAQLARADVLCTQPHLHQRFHVHFALRRQPQSGRP